MINEHNFSERSMNRMQRFKEPHANVRRAACKRSKSRMRLARRRLANLAVGSGVTDEEAGGQTTTWQANVKTGPLLADILLLIFLWFLVGCCFCVFWGVFIF